MRALELALPWTIEGRSEVEVAYLLDKANRGQGLATEVAGAIARYAFEQLQLTRLICLIDRENLTPIQVAEKIGMGFEKEWQDEKKTYLLYSMSKRIASPGQNRLHSPPDPFFGLISLQLHNPR